MNQIEKILERIKKEKNITSGDTSTNIQGKTRIGFELVNGQKHAVGYVDIVNENINVLIRDFNYSPKYLKNKLNNILDAPANFLFGQDVVIGNLIYLDGYGTNDQDYQIDNEYIISDVEIFELKNGYRQCNSSSFLTNPIRARYMEELDGPCINRAGYPMGRSQTLVFEILELL